MANVQESIDVAVPVSTAYHQWTQFETFPQFMKGVLSVSQLTEGTNHWITRIGGVEREFDTEITEQHADTRVAWKSIDGKTHAGVVTFHRLDENSSRVSVQMDWDPGTFVEKVGSAVGVDDHQVKLDLKRFKRFIEAQGAETGGFRGDVQALESGISEAGLQSPDGITDTSAEDPESGGPRIEEERLKG